MLKKSYIIGGLIIVVLIVFAGSFYLGTEIFGTQPTQVKKTNPVPTIPVSDNKADTTQSTSQTTQKSDSTPASTASKPQTENQKPASTAPAASVSTSSKDTDINIDGIPIPDSRIEIDTTSKTLKRYIGGQISKEYKISITNTNSLPGGKYKILQKTSNPHIPGSSSNNKISNQWLRLAKVNADRTVTGTDFGMHISIKDEKNGCILMTESDFTQLYTTTDVATVVVIK